MVVITMDSVDEGIRGECTKWLLEIKTGTFVGNINAAVRELLWERLTKKMRKGGATMIFTTNNEQGFDIWTYGDPKKRVEDFDGVVLIKTAKPLATAQS